MSEQLAFPKTAHGADMKLAKPAKFYSRAQMTFRPKAEKRSRNLDADIRAEQVGFAEGRSSAEQMPRATIRVRKVEMINGRKFYCIS